MRAHDSASMLAGRAVCVALLLAPCAARADDTANPAEQPSAGAQPKTEPKRKAGDKPRVTGSIADELGAGTAKYDPRDQIYRYLYDRLSGAIDPIDKLTLKLGATVTYEHAVADKSRPSSDRVVPYFTSGFEVRPNDNISFGGSFAGGPPVSGVGGLLSGSAYFDYDTAGESNVEHDAELLAGVSWYSPSDTSIPCSVPSDLAGCALTQFRINPEYTLTLFGTTDLTLSGAVYLYNDDALLAASAAQGVTALQADGLPVVPYRFNVRPEAAHWFGRLWVDAWFQAGMYASDNTTELGGGGTLRVKASQAVSPWVGLEGYAHLLNGSAPFRGSVWLGVKVKL